MTKQEARWHALRFASAWVHQALDSGAYDGPDCNEAAYSKIEWELQRIAERLGAQAKKITVCR